MGYYLTLAMHSINVSQTPYGSYSHPNGAMDICGADSGVDFFYCRTGYMKCIAKWEIGYNTFMFQPCDKDGNPVKVLCADGISRVVTIAMTHSNLRYVKTQVGKIYKQDEPIYEEGHCGGANLTGNHIHIEVAKGTVKSKYKDPTLGVWRMKGEMNPAKIFWIDDSFSKIINTHGLDFKICHKAQTDDNVKPATTIGYGYNIYTKDGITAHTVRAQKKLGFTLHLLSAGNGAKVLPVANFDSDKVVKTAVLNCNYFDRAKGIHYGVEQDGYLKGYHQEPKNGGLLCYYIKDGKSQVEYSDHYWFTQDEVDLAFTPYAVIMWGGRDVNYKSTNLPNKDNVREANAVLARCKNGEYVLLAFEEANLADIAKFLKSFKDDNIQDICILDGGGSTQLRAWTRGKMQTVVSGDKRKLPNVLCLARKPR